MEKGKVKTENRYLSIILIPHSSDSIRSMRFTALYYKLAVVLVLVLITIVTTGIFLKYTTSENQRLRKELYDLREQNIEQSNLLREKADEISKLHIKEEEANSKINEFMDKYAEITENYITNRSESLKTSRSGDRNERSFIEDIKQLKGVLDNLDQMNKSGGVTVTDLAETEKKLKEYTDCIPTLWPVNGRISSGFGSRKDPVFPKERFHAGLDLATNYGVNIKAAAKGTVTLSEWYGEYGYAVIIDHGNGIMTVYGHTSKLLVKKGQSVNKGDIIALVGSSGKSTGSHLHFEIRVNGTPVDPLKYLDN